MILFQTYSHCIVHVIRLYFNISIQFSDDIMTNDCHLTVNYWKHSKYCLVTLNQIILLALLKLSHEAADSFNFLVKEMKFLSIYPLFVCILYSLAGLASPITSSQYLSNKGLLLSFDTFHQKFAFNLADKIPIVMMGIDHSRSTSLMRNLIQYWIQSLQKKPFLQGRSN